MSTVRQVRAIADPARRSAAAVGAMDERRAEISALYAVRQGAVRQLVDEHGAAETAKRLGISVGAVYNLLREQRTRRGSAYRG
jgi:DNA invertase Pin-like site-specific DNA recombinase